MHYRAFISYSQVDRRWARWLHRALESYRPPRSLQLSPEHSSSRPLAPIFRDRDELPSSANLSEAVNEALESSERLIVICSPAAAASRWVNEEIRVFRRAGRTERILCLIVAGEPRAGGEAECFPAALTDLAEGVGPAHEPLAADARPGGDGRRRALLKLAAGMLGVGFDALNQRDLRRRHGRLVAATVGSLGIAVVTAALAIAATAARQDAELRRTQAEDLVDFMLGDLYESLYELDRLDLYDRIGDKALEYFARQRDDDATSRTLAQRARNLRQIGEVRIDRGDLTAALEAFSESLLITTSVAARNNAPDAMIDLANSRFFVGQVHYLRGDLPKARAEFEQVLPIVTGLLEVDPRNPRWLVEAGFAYTNLGRVLELEGALEEALAAYEAVMSANLTLQQLEPDNPEWELEVGFAHNNIGKVVIGLGRLDTAESHYRSDLEAKARVLALNPSHSMRRENLGVSQLFLGELLLDRGKLEEGRSYLQDALSTFDALLETDRERANWRTRRANVARALGRLYWAEGRSDAGRDSLHESMEALSSLVESDEDNVGWRRDLVQSLLASAELEARAGNVDAARSALSSSQRHQAVLEARGELRNRVTALLAIHVEVCAGEVAARDDPEAARGAFTSALESIRRHFPGSADPHLQELAARALVGLGRADEAAAIRSALQAIGFHAVTI